MNNNVKKLLVAGLACVAVCGTALAAPDGGNGGRGREKPRMQLRAKAQTPARRNHAATPARNHNKRVDVVHHHKPARPVVVHHAPPPPPRPAPVVVHHHECDGGLGLGALIGAVVGGLLGAAL